MKLLLSTFLLLLSFENVFSQSTVKFKGFELLDSVVYKPSESGVTYDESGNIMAIKGSGEYLPFKPPLSASFQGYIKNIEYMHKEYLVRNVIQLQDTLVVICLSGYAILTNPESKVKFIKESFFKYKNNWLYLEDMYPESKVYRNTMYFNSSIYIKSKKELINNIEEYFNSPEVISLRIKNDKLKFDKAIGEKSICEPNRARIHILRKSNFDLDTNGDKIITGSKHDYLLKISDLNGNLVSKFGEPGKLITFDSVIDSKALYEVYNYKIEKLSYSTVPSYNRIVIDSKNNLVFRTYFDGTRLEYNRDSLLAKFKYDKKLKLSDPYLNKMTGKKPAKGLQVYNLSVEPPSLIADIPYPENLQWFWYVNITEDGVYEFNQANSQTGICKKFRYKLLIN